MNGYTPTTNKRRGDGDSSLSSAFVRFPTSGSDGVTTDTTIIMPLSYPEIAVTTTTTRATFLPIEKNDKGTVAVAAANDDDNDNDNDDAHPFIPLRETKSHDVLLGRGRPLQKHPGNLRLRHLIANRLLDYEQANKHRKTELAETIVQHIYQEGGRFLKQPTTTTTTTKEKGKGKGNAPATATATVTKKKKGESDSHSNQGDTTTATTTPLYSVWEEIDDHTARLKVSYTFRTFRKMKKAKQNQAVVVVQVASES